MPKLRRFKCDLCPSSFDYKKGLIMHKMRVHDGKGPQKDKEGAIPSVALQHLGPKDLAQTTACHICGYIPANVRGLQVHLAAHARNPHYHIPNYRLKILSGTLPGGVAAADAAAAMGNGANGTNGTNGSKRSKSKTANATTNATNLLDLIPASNEAGHPNTANTSNTSALDILDMALDIKIQTLTEFKTLVRQVGRMRL